jgi:hypothetical protein
MWERWRQGDSLLGGPAGDVFTAIDFHHVDAALVPVERNAPGTFV